MSNNDLGYVLDDQVGYKLRLANQRHLEIFADELPELTPTQFSVMVRLHQHGSLSQNHLGREVGMNAATTKGVVLLPGNPPIQCLSTTISLFQFNCFPEVIIAFVRSDISSISIRSPAQAVINAERCMLE